MLADRLPDLRDDQCSLPWIENGVDVRAAADAQRQLLTIPSEEVVSASVADLAGHAVTREKRPLIELMGAIPKPTRVLTLEF